MRAVIYARVSTDEQANKGHSLQSQIDACRHYALEKRLVVVAEYKDEVSGAILDRPGLDELRERVVSDKIAIIIVYDLDRLSRKPIHQLLLEEEFAKRGAQVHYVLGQYDNSPEGNFQKQIRSAVAEYEREKIRERSIRGRRQMAKAGFYVPHGAPPYGYRRGEKDGRVILEINEDEARIVRLIYHWYVEGDDKGQVHSFFSIARKLSEMEIPSPGATYKRYKKKSSPTHWSPTAVATLIRQETYAGVWYYSRYDFSHKPKVRPKSEWIPVKIPAIVDRKTWDLAQKRASQNRRHTHPNPKHKYLMQARLQCAHCQYAYSGSTSTYRGGKDIYSFYRCCGKSPAKSYHWHDKKCTARQVRADAVDRFAWEFVQSVLANPEQLTRGLRAKQHEQRKASAIQEEQLKILDTELENCRVKLARLIDLFAEDQSGTLTKSLFAEKEAELNRRMNSIEVERNAIVERLTSTVLSDEAIQTIEELTPKLKEGFDNATFEDRRWFVEVLDVRGIVKQIEKHKSVVEFSCLLTETAVGFIVARFYNRRQKNPINFGASSSDCSPCPWPAYGHRQWSVPQNEIRA